MLLGVQPQHLAVAALLGLLRGEQAGRVVAAGLGLTGTAQRRPHIIVADPQADRVEALGEVRPHRRQDNEEQVLVGRPHAQRGLGADHRRPDIERAALGRGDPALLGLDQLADGLDEVVGRDLGHADPAQRGVHAAGVLVGPEQQDLAVGRLVGFHALEHFLAVVQHVGGRVQRQRAVGPDLGIMPAACLVPLHGEHVVGELAAEHQLQRVGIQWLELVLGQQGFPDIHGRLSLYSNDRFTKRLFR